MLEPVYINNQKSYVLEKRIFSIAGVTFEATGFEITGRGIHDITHTIKNTQTGESKEYSMPALIRIYQKHFAA
jgi:uncharacterized protein YbjQ (UPF0145 family)